MRSRRIFSMTAIALILSCVFAARPSSLRAQSGNNAPAMLERVLPSVVTVGVSESQTAKKAFGYSGDPSDAAYKKVLDLTGVVSSGSGFLIERGGKKYVVTNAHVVEEAGGEKALTVYSINQTRYPVHILGGDSFYDLAVLEFSGQQPGSEFSTLEFSQAEPRLGDVVFAIGNPLGDYPYTVTQGIVGGKNRMFNGLTGKFGYLQSTATVIWGNSGGPLVDSDGKVVGVNSRIEIRKIGEQNYVQPQLNFALEAKIVQRIINDVLTNNGRVRRAYLGLEISQSSRVAGENGQYVTKIDQVPVLSALLPGGPAARALQGKEGSKVLQINGDAIRNTEEALGALEQTSPGGEVTFELERSGRREQVKVKSEELTTEVLGRIAKSVVEHHAAAEVVEGENGVVVRERSVTPSSPATPQDDRLNVRGQGYQYEKNSRRYQKSGQGTGTSVSVAAAGIVVDESNVNVWRVHTLADLGVAIRLSALAGFIDLVVGETSGSTVYRVGLSTQEDIVSPTVIY